MKSAAKSRGTCPVAYFDFDGTLTTGDTLMPFLKYVVGTRAYYAKLVIVGPILAAYAVGLLRNDLAKEAVLKQYLAGYHIDKLFELGRSFSEEVVPGLLRPEGIQYLKWHQAQGHECVLVSASMDVYLNAWARHEQFSGVICTTLERTADGYVSGGIDGENCHGHEKLKRLLRWQADRNPIETYGYGDTSGDLPMLNFVDHGRVWNNKVNSFIPV